MYKNTVETSQVDSKLADSLLSQAFNLPKDEKYLIFEKSKINS